MSDPSDSRISEAAQSVYERLRLKTFPVCVTFHSDKAQIPPDSRPSAFMGKKINLCQAVSLARFYGMTVGITNGDIMCSPAAVVFGLTDLSDPRGSVARLWQEAELSKGSEQAEREAACLSWLQRGEIEGVVFAPARAAEVAPHNILLYGNAHQMALLCAAWSYATGERVGGNFGGKVECADYLVSPFKSGKPQVVIPGVGERIFAGTQDDELVFALPAPALPDLASALAEVGGAIGVGYPLPPYQFFEPSLPEPHRRLAEEAGIL